MREKEREREGGRERGVLKVYREQGFNQVFSFKLTFELNTGSFLDAFWLKNILGAIKSFTRQHVLTVPFFDHIPR